MGACRGGGRPGGGSSPRHGEAGRRERRTSERRKVGRAAGEGEVWRRSGRRWGWGVGEWIRRRGGKKKKEEGKRKNKEKITKKYKEV